VPAAGFLGEEGGTTPPAPACIVVIARSTALFNFVVTGVPLFAVSVALRSTARKVWPARVGDRAARQVFFSAHLGGELGER